MSLHGDALARLGDWTAPTADQGELRERFVAHLNANPDGMERACFPDHLTAGTLILDRAGTSVLLNLHRKAQRWFAFGGHCEPEDATLASVALREAHEESGLSDLVFDPTPAQLDAHPVEFCDRRGTVTHLDVRYVAFAPDTDGHTVSEESLDVRWWPIDALPELEPAMHDLIAIARGRLAVVIGGQASRSSSLPGGGSNLAAADQPLR